MRKVLHYKSCAKPPALRHSSPLGRPRMLHLAPLAPFMRLSCLQQHLLTRNKVACLIKPPAACLHAAACRDAHGSTTPRATHSASCSSGISLHSSRRTSFSFSFQTLPIMKRCDPSMRILDTGEPAERTQPASCCTFKIFQVHKGSDGRCSCCTSSKVCSTTAFRWRGKSRALNATRLNTVTQVIAVAATDTVWGEC